MKQLGKSGLRVVLCALLLTWIFHSIFVDEARRASDPSDWQSLTRMEKWRQGWTQGPPRLWTSLTRMDPGSMVLSLVLMGITIVLGAVRWRMVLRVQGLTLPFGRTFEISLVAHFFNSLFLGSTGGDLMKAYYAAHETHHRKTEAVITVFVDRLIGLWAMLLFAGVMMIPNYRTLLDLDRVGKAAGLLVVAMLAGCTVLLLLSFWGGVTKRWASARVWLRRLPKGEHLERSLDACRQFGKARLFVVNALILSMLLNLVVVVQWWVVGNGLGFRVPFAEMLAAVPIAICVAALPVTPNGLGVRENLFVHLLANTAVATTALSISLIAFAGSLFWSVIGGVVYLLFKRQHRLPPPAPPE